MIVIKNVHLVTITLVKINTKISIKRPGCLFPKMVSHRIAGGEGNNLKFQLFHDLYSNSLFLLDLHQQGYAVCNRNLDKLSIEWHRHHHIHCRNARDTSIAHVAALCARHNPSGTICGRNHT